MKSIEFKKTLILNMNKNMDKTILEKLMLNVMLNFMIKKQNEKFFDRA